METSIAVRTYRISIYNLANMELMRTLSSDSTTAFTSLSFSTDEKYLVSCNGHEGLSQIIYWKWTKEKVLVSTTLSEKIDRIHFNPKDSTHFTVSGPWAFKQIKINPDYTLKVTAMVSSIADVSITYTYIYI